MPPRQTPVSDLLASSEYLSPTFSPLSLTVPQLTGILQHHGVDTRPAAGKKAALVQMFTVHVGARRDELERERARNVARSPKATGIRDGLTGRLVNGAESTPSPRRSSRRASRQPSPPPTASSSRRSLPAPSSSLFTPDSDDDEPEAVSDAEPFSSENVFQSGSPTPEATPASAVVRKGGRRSSPVVESPSAAVAARRAGAGGGGARRKSRLSMPSTPPDEDSDAEPEPEPEPEPTPAVEVDVDTTSYPHALAPTPTSFLSRLLRPSIALPFLLSVLALSLLRAYAVSSSQLGFCLTNSTTNPIVLERLSLLEESRRCASLPLDSRPSSCPNPPLLPPSLQPLHCTPCPAHALCPTPSTISCPPPLTLSPHPLHLLSPLLSGLPLLGPVAFPPRCIEDRRWDRLVTRAKLWTREYLETLRGERVCSPSSPTPTPSAGPDIPEPIWAGTRLSSLRSALAALKQTQALQPDKVDALLASVLEGLREEGAVLSGTDGEGGTWVAARRARLGVWCSLKLGAAEVWRAWRVYVLLSSLLLASLLYVRQALRSRLSDSRLATSLLPPTLAHLRTHPSTPHLSAHLRDTLLSSEHNLSRRQRIWKQVERVVEGNANVRVGEEEVGGEVGRGWRWVGPGEVYSGDPNGMSLERREMKY